MNPRHIQVSRTARYYLLGPEQGAARLWVALHGYSQLAQRFLAALQPLADAATLIAAPEALSRFYLGTAQDGRHEEAIGASWMTREDREADIHDTVAYLERLADELRGGLLPRAGIGILGFSQGGAMAARWVAHGRIRPAHLVLWGSGVPADVTPAALAAGLGQGRLTLVAGDADRFITPHIMEKQAAALRLAGVDARVERFAGGHALASAVLERIAAAGLEHPAPGG
jgi:predicted esterase